jgi:hypothetical protein
MWVEHYRPKNIASASIMLGMAEITYGGRLTAFTPAVSYDAFFSTTSQKPAALG